VPFSDSHSTSTLSKKSLFHQEKTFRALQGDLDDIYAAPETKQASQRELQSKKTLDIVLESELEVQVSLE